MKVINCKQVYFRKGEVSSLKKLYEANEVLSIYGGPLPVSKAGLYKWIAEKKVPSVRIGRRVFIPAWYVEKLLRNHSSNNNKRPAGRGGQGGVKITCLTLLYQKPMNV